MILVILCVMLYILVGIVVALVDTRYSPNWNPIDVVVLLFFWPLLWPHLVILLALHVRKLKEKNEQKY